MDTMDAGGRFPFTAFPDGWFLFELSRNLPVGRLVGRPWMGRQVVGWRDRAGRICVADAFCPHLGARLSPETGGVIENGNLVCPVPRLHLRRLRGLRVHADRAAHPGMPAQALSGGRSQRLCVRLVDQTTREPRWRLPAVSEAGWTPTTTQRYRIRSHPLATTENTIDLDHLRFLHHFEAVRQVGESELDGPNFNTRFRFEGSYDIPLLRHLRFALSAAVSLWGLGFLFVETVAPSLAVRTMNWFLTTPIDGEHVDFWCPPKYPQWSTSTSPPTAWTRGCSASSPGDCDKHSFILWSCTNSRSTLKRISPSGTTGRTVSARYSADPMAN